MLRACRARQGGFSGAAAFPTTLGNNPRHRAVPRPGLKQLLQCRGSRKGGCPGFIGKNQTCRSCSPIGAEAPPPPTAIYGVTNNPWDLSRGGATPGRIVSGGARGRPSRPAYGLARAWDRDPGRARCASPANFCGVFRAQPTMG